MKKPIRIRAGAALLLIGLMLMGCASRPTAAPFISPRQPTPEVTMPDTNESLSPLPTPRATAAQRDSSPMADVARRDLAGRLGIAEDQIEVVSVEKTEMPAGSLGCGETGGLQSHGLIIGDEIVLRVGDQEYIYHADVSKVVPCSPVAMPSSQPMRPTSTSAPVAQPTAQDLAVADLAGRLGVKPTAITVRRVIGLEWPDASLGCPEPGMMYAQVITPGEQIILEANGRTYEYHAGRGRVILCRP